MEKIASILAGMGSLFFLLIWHWTAVSYWIFGVLSIVALTYLLAENVLFNLLIWIPLYIGMSLWLLWFITVRLKKDVCPKVPTFTGM